MITKSQRKELYAIVHKILAVRDQGCVRCGSFYGLQASHIYGKGAHPGLAYNTENIIYLCYNCHDWWHRHPKLGWEWLKSMIPKERMDKLKVLAQQTGERNYKSLKSILEEQLKKCQQTARPF